MKELTKDNLRRTLGINLDNYIRENKIKRSDFADEINKILCLDIGDINAQYKKVSRWISGENIPDAVTMVAISEIIGVDVCELFKKEINFDNRIKSLTSEEKSTLYKLLVNSCDGNLFASNVYIPIEYNGSPVELEKGVYSREQILKYFKGKSENAFSMKRMMDFICYYEKGFMKNIESPEKHFPRFCSVKFIENDKDDWQESVLYSDDDDFYKKISSVWSKFPNEEFYNVVYFEERSYDYEDDPWGIDKASFYKAKSFADEVYEKKFGNLLRLGLIKEPTKTETKTEWDDGTIAYDEYDPKKRINVLYDVDTAYGNLSQCRSIMFTICFSFELNISNVELNDLIKNIRGGNV